jgi:hypothetical protein
MTAVFVPDYDWNSQFSSPEDHVEAGREYGESEEGSEFSLVRLTVGAKTTYRIVDGKPVVVSIAFPDALSVEG